MKKEEPTLRLIKHLKKYIVKIDRQIEEYGDKAGHLWHIKNTVFDVINWAELFLHRSNKK